MEIKMMIERKLAGGGYSSFCEMATDINNGRPAKEIEFFFVAKNMDIFRKEVSMIMSVPLFFSQLRSILFRIIVIFVILDYSVYETQFSIKIHYFKLEFEHLIKQYKMKMIKAIQSNRILRYSGWLAGTVFVDNTSDPPYFGDCVVLTVISY